MGRSAPNHTAAPRFVAALLIATLIGSASPDRADALVYVNRQWDDDIEEWVVRPLYVTGGSYAIDRDFQNAYGEFMDLDPGPPIIFEAGVYVENVYDENDDVVEGGFFSISTWGEGGEPDFDLVFSDAEYEPYLQINGAVSIAGRAGDPVIFTGTYRINTQYRGVPDDAFEDSHYETTFRYCRFEEYHYYPDWLSYVPLDLDEGHVTIENCTFKYYGEDVDCIILKTDAANIGVWRFALRGCTFANNNLSEYHVAPVVLRWLGPVSIENNTFINNQFAGGATGTWHWSVVKIEDCGVGRIAGNAGDGNTSNCIQLIGHNDVYGEAYVRSSDDFPLIVETVHVNPYAKLEIDGGSLLKIYAAPDGYTNFFVEGELSMDGAVLTSWQDDTRGGDTDNEPMPPSPMPWGTDWGAPGGIHIEPTGSATLDGCTLLHADLAICTMGNLFIDKCTFRFGENEFIRCAGGIENNCTVRGSTFEISEGTSDWTAGVSLDNETGSAYRLRVEDSRFFANDDGIELDCAGSGAVDAVITGCTIAGNRHQGVYITSGSALDTLTIERTLIAANHLDGVYCSNAGASMPVVRLEGNVIAGNGWLGASSKSCGARLHDGTLDCINNTVIHNRDYGLSREYADPGGDETAADNLFCFNGDVGYFKPYTEHPLFAHNCFWENDGGNELGFRTSEGYLWTVEEVQALGGDFATNRHEDPLLIDAVEAVVTGVAYDDTIKQSTVVVDGAPFGAGALAGLIVRPDRSGNGWFYILDNTADTLFLADDASLVAASGDTCRILDYHLGTGSGMRDAGINSVVAALMDIDGEHRIIDGDNDQTAVVDIGADELNPASFSLLVLSPAGGEHLIPGESHDIVWSAVGVDSIDILFGAHFDPDSCSFMEIAVGIPAAAGRYEWTVPDTLSAACIVEILDVDDSDRYARSGLFAVKGYELARLDTAGEYEAFAPGADDWRFANNEENMWPESWWSRHDYEGGIDPYTGEAYPAYFSSSDFISAEPNDFPSWPLFVNAFCVEQCYIDSPAGPQYRPSAVLRWAMIKEEWAGSCFGFAVSALVAFDDTGAFLAAYPAVDPFDRLHALLLDDDHRETVNTIFLMQYGADFSDRIAGDMPNRPAETLADIEDMLLADERDDRWLYLGNVHGSGAHAVVPYRVEAHQSMDELRWIYVYDSNHPNDATTRILVDTASNTWQYDVLPGWGGDSLLFLGDPASASLAAPVLETAQAPLWPIRGQSAQRSPADGAPWECYATAGASITVTDGGGHSIGFADSTVCNGIPGARPVIPMTGGYHPPIGYRLPAGEYGIEATDFPDSSFLFSFFEDSTAYAYGRCDAAGAQCDRLSCGDELSIVNEDGSGKTCGAQVIIARPAAERVFEVREVALAGGDSMRLFPRGGDTLGIVNNGPEKVYELALRTTSESGHGGFEHADIPLPADASHTVIPPWDDLDALAVMVFVDYGDDGTVEDTLFLENELTATLLRGFECGANGSAIEITWRLSEIDDGVEFIVLRTEEGGAGRFERLDDIDIHRDGLAFTARDRSIARGRTYRYRIKYSIDGTVRTLFETGPVTAPPLPLTLFQNYPNPFNPSTRIDFYLPADEHVVLDIYDTSGRLVVRLADEKQRAGRHTIEWDGRNRKGRPAASGIYYYRLRAGKRTLSRKLVLLR